MNGRAKAAPRADVREFAPAKRAGSSNEPVGTLKIVDNRNHNGGMSDGN